MGSLQQITGFCTVGSCRYFGGHILYPVAPLRPPILHTRLWQAMSDFCFLNYRCLASILRLSEARAEQGHCNGANHPASDHEQFAIPSPAMREAVMHAGSHEPERCGDTVHCNQRSCRADHVELTSTWHCGVAASRPVLVIACASAHSRVVPHKWS